MTHISVGKVVPAVVYLVVVTLLLLAAVSAIQFNAPEYTVSEGNGSITVTMCLAETNNSEAENDTETITVTLSTLSQSAGKTCPLMIMEQCL